MPTLMLMIRFVRLACGLTQFELARRARLSSTRVSMLERGLVPPTPTEAAALGRVLGMPPAELFEPASLGSLLGRTGESGRPSPAGCVA